MPSVATFTRLYRDSVGFEHTATPEYVSNVLRSMREAADGDVPFRVRFRMDDGTMVVVSPKKARA